MVGSVLAVVLLMAGLCCGQGFVTFVYETDQPLLTNCENSAAVPIPDGTTYYLYQDLDGDGPDADDDLATLCDDAPHCLSGEPGSLNWNALPVNGVSMGLGAGLFYPEYGFASRDTLPAVNRFYIAVPYPGLEGARVVWTSNVFSPARGYSEIELSSWTCSVDLSDCTDEVTFTPREPEEGPQDSATCVALCPGQAVTVEIGPVTSPHFWPYLTLTGACDTCWLAPTAWELSGWIAVNVNGGFYLRGRIELPDVAWGGCLTVQFDSLDRTSGGKTPDRPIVRETMLHPNYPNPFNAETQLRFQLAKTGEARLAVYNLRGQEVARPVAGRMAAGEHAVRFEARALPSGVYFARLEADGVVGVRKMVLMK